MKKALFPALFLIIIQCSAFCEKFSFAVLGDNRDGDQVFTDAISKINNDPDIKFIINTGDITPNGTTDEYKKYWSMAARSRVKIYDVLGNHDIGYFGAGRNTFKNKYKETYYSFDDQDKRFIFLDNNSSKGLGRKQLLWLKAQLETDKKLFVSMHKPIVDATGLYPHYVMMPAEENEAIHKLMTRSKVKYAFAGHIHGYGREVSDNVVYIIAGGAGAPLYLPHFGGGYYNYVKVTVNDNTITDEVVTIYNEE